MIFQDPRRVPASTFMVFQSMRELRKDFLELLSNFIEASKKFKINYNKRSTDLIVWSFKKCPSRDTILLSICCKPGSLILYCPVEQFTQVCTTEHCVYAYKYIEKDSKHSTANI
jgi:hypothetical protein